MYKSPRCPINGLTMGLQNKYIQELSHIRMKDHHRRTLLFNPAPGVDKREVRKGSCTHM